MKAVNIQRKKMVQSHQIWYLVLISVSSVIGKATNIERLFCVHFNVKIIYASVIETCGSKFPCKQNNFSLKQLLSSLRAFFEKERQNKHLPYFNQIATMKGIYDLYFSISRCKRLSQLFPQIFLQEKELLYPSDLEEVIQVCVLNHGYLELYVKKPSETSVTVIIHGQYGDSFMKKPIHRSVFPVFSDEKKQVLGEENKTTSFDQIFRFS